MQPLSAHEQVLQEKATNYSLEDDLRKAWNNSVASVFKDLPRLAKRTTVDSASIVIVSDGRLVSTDYKPHNIKKMRRKNRETLEKMDSLLKSLIPDDKLPHTSIWGEEPHGIEDSDEEKPAASSADGPDLVHETSESTECISTQDSDPSTSQPNHADLPSSEGQENFDPLLNPLIEPNPKVDDPYEQKEGFPDKTEGFPDKTEGFPDKNEDGNCDEKEQELPPITSWKAICNVLNTLTSFLEESGVHNKVKSRLKELDDEINDKTDFESLLQELFENEIPKDSRTFKVLKGVNQNMIFPSMFKLHTTMFKGNQMRDVRTSDGWKVFINLSQSISVTHRRWMQNMAPEDSPEYYRIQWEVKLSFDEEMIDMRAAILRLLKLDFNPHMDKEEQQKLRKLFLGGHVIL